MIGSSKQHPPSVRADYLRGDPTEDGPITRGRLELEPQGLHFKVPGGPDLRIELEALEALTVSGRSPYERPRRRTRGTMLVAARRNGDVDVWEFALERKAGAMLQDRINRELHAQGLRRPPLPFVEQLVGPVGPPNDTNGRNGHGSANGAASGGEERSGLHRLQFALIAFAIAAVVAAEVILALSLLR
jgi:hypothetical protein